MADKKIIAVVGATGAQGGGLVRAICRDQGGPFTARAITRDPASDQARALAALGAEVVAADAHDPASMKRAFAGAHGAYCVTFFWAHFSPEQEIAEARSMAEAARHARIEHVIWSTLEDTRTFMSLDDPRMPTIGGKYKLPHFDAKGECDALFADLPTTFSLASFYWENLIYFGAGPKPGPDGTLALTFPMGDRKMAGIASEDIGKCAYGMLKRGRDLVGKRIGLAGEHLTIAEMAAKLTTALGRTVRYNSATPDAYRAFGFPAAVELGNMFQFYRDFETELNRTRDVARSRALNPELLSFDQWLEANAGRIPLT